MLRYALAATIAIGAMTPAADAAPFARAGSELTAGAGSAAGIDTVAYRKCWTRNGKRHCRLYRGEPAYRYRDDDGYYEHDADKLPYGSQRWWDQMLRENRAGNPGGGGRQ